MFQLRRRYIYTDLAAETTPVGMFLASCLSWHKVVKKDKRWQNKKLTKTKGCQRQNVDTKSKKAKKKRLKVEKKGAKKVKTYEKLAMTKMY